MAPKIVLTEQQLLAAIQMRSAEGAQLLYDHYAATLRKVIWCTVKNNAITDEVLEDTFILAWNAIEDFFKQESRLLLWMSGIARSIAKERMVALSFTVASAAKPILNISLPVFNQPRLAFQ